MDGLEFYKLIGMPQQYGTSLWWEITMDGIEDPTCERFVALSRSHGTLVFEDKEYTVLSIDDNSLEMHYTLLVRTPTQPDKFHRILVITED